MLLKVDINDNMRNIKIQYNDHILILSYHHTIVILRTCVFTMWPTSQVSNLNQNTFMLFHFVPRDHEDKWAALDEFWRRFSAADEYWRRCSPLDEYWRGGYLSETWRISQSLRAGVTDEEIGKCFSKKSFFLETSLCLHALPGWSFCQHTGWSTDHGDRSDRAEHDYDDHHVDEDQYDRQNLHSSNLKHIRDKIKVKSTASFTSHPL